MKVVLLEPLRRITHPIADVQSVTGVTGDNIDRCLPMLLPENGVAVVKMNGNGDHCFVLTGHGDQVSFQRLVRLG